MASAATPLQLSSGSTTDPAMLRFSVDFDSSRADSKPSVLLLTQNIGGIEATLGTNVELDDPSLDGTRTLTSGQSSDISAAIASVSRVFGGPSLIQVPDEIDAELGISPVVRQQVAEFLSDLRQWLHRLSYVSAAVRAAEASAAAPSLSPTSVAGGAPSSSSAPSSPPSPPPSGAAANMDAYMRSYTPLVRPPLVDIVVLHFQEIGGKYKNKQFNEYFKEQVRTVLLPEAGWTSELLMDERESSGTVSSSSYQRHRGASTTQRRRMSSFQASNAANANGDINGHVDDHNADAQCPTDANTADIDLIAELDVDADAFFTAIGSIVFLSPRVMGIASCLSVPHRTYIPIVDDPLTYAGDAGRLFHSGKFAEAGRSRKGFLLLSLRLGTVQLNVCNVHLFNDDDNRVALGSSPSPYTGRRARALKEAIAECSAVVDLSEPLFIFGDYNVRMDGKGFAQWVEEKMQMTVRPEKKRLRCPEHFWELFTDPAMQQELRTRFDVEPQHMMDEVALLSSVELAEMPIHFAPTYSRIPYLSRTGVADAATPRDAAVTLDAQLQTSSLKDFAGEAAALRADEQGKTGAIRAGPLLSMAPPSCSSSPPPPPSTSPVASVLRTHLTASPYRDNFCHDRLPAWCDRVLFNVAGLEWIAGHCARSAQPPPPAPSAGLGSTSSGAGSLKGKQRGDQGCWYAYAAVDFVHTDHDGVFMLF